MREGKKVVIKRYTEELLYSVILSEARRAQRRIRSIMKLYVSDSSLRPEKTHRDSVQNDNDPAVVIHSMSPRIAVSAAVIR